ncbi:MAG: hypothetical protein KDC38_10555, partial [Planctomycetes bacterium]|nr:hypothetical protein [Planctomycetota bacterium]
DSSAGWLSREELDAHMREIAAKNIPVCALINSCYSGGLLAEDDWALPPGSVILTSADASHRSYGGPQYRDATGNCVPYSIYPYAFSQCLNVSGLSALAVDANGDGTIDDCEADAWVHLLAPLFWYSVDGVEGTVCPTEPSGPNPDPQPVKRVAVTPPDRCFTFLCNATGEPQTSFEIEIAGEATGIGLARRLEEGNDLVPWGSSATVTSDAETGRTTVQWSDPSDPILPGQYIVVAFLETEGRPVRRLGQHWGTAGSPSATAPVPTTNAGAHQGTDGVESTIRVFNRSETTGGLDEPVQVTVGYRLAASALTLEDLAPQSDAYATLTYVPLGTAVLGAGEFVEWTGPAVPAGGTLLIETQATWGLDGSSVLQVESVAPRGPALSAPFRRGDSNGDEAFDLGDAITTLSALFGGAGPLSCADAGDANDDGSLDVGDPIYTLSALFTGGALPPAPRGICGGDPTLDDLDCAEFGGCD